MNFVTNPGYRYLSSGVLPALLFILAPVDTLFQVNKIPSLFSLSDDGRRNGIKPCVIERLIVFQHAVNRMPSCRVRTAYLFIVTMLRRGNTALDAPASIAYRWSGCRYAITRSVGAMKKPTNPENQAPSSNHRAIFSALQVFSSTIQAFFPDSRAIYSTIRVFFGIVSVQRMIDWA